MLRIKSFLTGVWHSGSINNGTRHYFPLSV
jgi:hypothetical protein